MNRLTMWYDGNHAICENEECSSGDCPFADPICEQVQNIIDRLAAIEDILGDEYDLDELREMVQAKREGRVRIEEKTYQCPKCGAYRLTPRVDGKFYLCFNCKTQFTKEEAEDALRREQDG